MKKAMTLVVEYSYHPPRKHDTCEERYQNMKKTGKLRFGLCCIFRKEPIKFRQVTAKTLRPLGRPRQLELASEICMHNVKSLQKSLGFAARNDIGAFRIMSPLFPRYTHIEVGYDLDDLPDDNLIRQVLFEIKNFRKAHDIRLSFHPDQFNVLSSAKPEVIKNTNRELAYHGMLSDMVDAEVINIHAGGVYGDKDGALKRLYHNVKKLPQSVLSRITLENDDVSYTPADLLPFCEKLKIPMVYDVHHHRCLPDGLSEEEVTERVMKLWQKLHREPYFHISSPRNGWKGGTPKPHSDYIDLADFPSCWKGLTATVDIEAKAKELAIFKLREEMNKNE